MINFISIMYLYFLAVFSIVLLIITLFNIVLSRKCKIGKLDNFIIDNPLVSVLIPARNEEINIKRCLYSILKQSYSNIEILVLDDDSSDKTNAYAHEISKIDNRVKVIDGGKIPQGWLGKNWACHQLSEKANGNLMLFVDSDTEMKPTLILESIKMLLFENIDLLSLFPNRKATTFIDKVVSVTIGWVIFSWIPLVLSNRSKLPIFSTAFGQFLLFKKSSYQAIGGHKRIKLEILDDFELGRNISREKLKLKIINGVNYIDTFSFKTEREAMDGFVRAIFPAFLHSLIGFSIFFILFISITFVPFIIYLVQFFDITLDQTKLSLIFLIWILLTCSWVLTSLKTKQSILLAILFPIVTLSTSLIGLYSVFSFFFENINWKNREIIFEQEEEEEKQLSK